MLIKRNVKIKRFIFIDIKSKSPPNYKYTDYKLKNIISSI